MIIGRPDYRPSAYDDDFEDIPSMGFWPKWFGGILLPLALIAYGIICFITQHGHLGGENGPMEIFGTKAIALGVAAMSLGLFLHCHYFWGNIFHLSPWAVIGKIVSAITFIGGLGYLIVQIGIFGRTR